MLFRRLSGVQPIGKRSKQAWLDFVQCIEGDKGTSSSMEKKIKSLTSFLDMLPDAATVAMLHAEIRSSITMDTVLYYILNINLVSFKAITGADSSYVPWSFTFSRSLNFLRNFVNCYDNNSDGSGGGGSGDASVADQKQQQSNKKEPVIAMPDNLFR